MSATLRSLGQSWGSPPEHVFSHREQPGREQRGLTVLSAFRGAVMDPRLTALDNDRPDFRKDFGILSHRPHVQGRMLCLEGWPSGWVTNGLEGWAQSRVDHQLFRLEVGDKCPQGPARGRLLLNVLSNDPHSVQAQSARSSG